MIKRMNKTAVSPMIRLFFAVFTAVLLAVLPLSSALGPNPLLMTAYAEEWSEDYYRATDGTGELTDAQQESLDADCIAFMRDFHADLSLLCLTTEQCQGETLKDVAREFYDSCGFGYGENRDGFQMVFNTDTNEAVIEAYGAAQDLIPSDYLDWAAAQIVEYRNDYGIFGPMYATIGFLRNYVETQQEQRAEGSDIAAAPETDSGNAAEPETDSGSSAEPETDSGSATEPEVIIDPFARVGEGADLPAWFPLNPDIFPEYHDETAPRVVDTADLFTDEQESAMESRLAEIREELSKDIVVFTDISTYGMDLDVYGADFFDFNGYGIGDEYEGVALCICMDPNDRGWWVCCSGPETIDVYTEEVANQIDDMLYDYMVAGEYYEGVSDWIENFRRLYKSGSPYTPEWAMRSEETFERFHDENAPRVVDEAGLLTEEEIASLTEKASAISQKYGLDVVICTAKSPANMAKQEYSDKFYLYNGYGLGDDYDGIQMTVFKRSGDMASNYITASGKGAAKLTEVNEDRLLSRCKDVLNEYKYYKALDAWLDQTEHMLRTGRAPRSGGSWFFSIFCEVVLGLVVGGITLARAAKRMATPKIAENADGYLVRDSLNVRKVSDNFLRTVTTRTYSPRETKSSGGGSSSGGGRSSYKSSYSGHSGRSHSGSGRKF